MKPTPPMDPRPPSSAPRRSHGTEASAAQHARSSSESPHARSPGAADSPVRQHASQSALKSAESDDPIGATSTEPDSPSTEMQSSACALVGSRQARLQRSGPTYQQVLTYPTVRVAKATSVLTADGQVNLASAFMSSSTALPQPGGLLKLMDLQPSASELPIAVLRVPAAMEAVSVGLPHIPRPPFLDLTVESKEIRLHLCELYPHLDTLRLTAARVVALNAALGEQICQDFPSTAMQQLRQALHNRFPWLVNDERATISQQELLLPNGKSTTLTVPLFDSCKSCAALRHRH